MTWQMWAGFGGVLALGVAAWALLRGGGAGREDLGTISGQWIAEHRAHERESEDR
jgi:hypothetical protein